MVNKITEKYFTQTDFSKKEKKALARVSSETGFILEKEIFRGVIYDKNKVGSLIYKGTWKNKPAVLKLQGLKPEINEGEIVKHFTIQNKSKTVRLPKLYVHSSWNKKHGYGYLITEYINAPHIFEMPFAIRKEMLDFADFYQEYKSSALIRSWIKPETLNSLEFTIHRVNHWRKITESKKRLKPKDYMPYLIKYYPIAVKYLPEVPMEFCHGHLTAKDIYKLPNKSFVILSNLFWSYRPQWYDLAFNIWSCLMHIRDTKYSFQKMLRYINSWLNIYQKIPIVKKDKNFNKKILILLLERTIGSILVDLGANDEFGKKENIKYFKHLLGLHQKLFNYLIEKLNV